MAENQEREQRDELAESELEEQDGEELPDREAMSVVTPPFAPQPAITLPVDPPD